MRKSKSDIIERRRRKRLDLWYSRFEPKPAKGFGAATKGEQSRGMVGKTYPL